MAKIADRIARLEARVAMNGRSADVVRALAVFDSEVSEIGGGLDPEAIEDWQQSWSLGRAMTELYPWGAATFPRLSMDDWRL